MRAAIGAGACAAAMALPAQAQVTLGTITVTATVGGGGGGGGGGGPFTINWNTDTQSWNIPGGMPAEVLAAMCEAVEAELDLRNCDSVQPPEPNGCGPVGGFSPPQSVFGSNFGSPCNRHDACYASAGVNQGWCDAEFLVNLSVVCWADFNLRIDLARELQGLDYTEAVAVATSELIACQAIATGYVQAVVTFGSLRYDAAQRAGACDALRDAQSDLCEAP